MLPRCPRCGGGRIDENMSFSGPMVCLDCGFRVEDKTARPNPFLEAAKQAAAARGEEGREMPQQSLGAALYERARARRKGPAADPPQDEEDQ